MADEMKPRTKREREEAISKKVEKLLKEFREYRELGDAKREENERFYDGKQWPSGQNDRRPVKNWCFTTVEGEVPILTDTRPSTDIIPTNEDPELKEKAKMLEMAVKHVYAWNGLDLKLAEVVRTMLKVGNGYLHLEWDADANDGEGEILINVLPWPFVYLDPASSEIERSMGTIIERPAYMEDLKRKYPDKADEIVEIKPGSNTVADKSSGLQSDTHWQKGFSQEFQDHLAARYKGAGITTVIEAYTKDYSLEDIPKEATKEDIAKEKELFLQLEHPEVSKWENHREHLRAHQRLAKEIVAESLGIEVGDVKEVDLEAVLANGDETALMLTIINDHNRTHEQWEEVNPTSQRPVYKNNLRYTVKSGPTVLYDGEPPTTDGLVPLVPFYCYKTENSPYAGSELDNIVPIQKSYNQMDYKELQGLRLNANSGWIVDASAGVNPGSLTNEEGLVVVKDGPGDVQRIPPGQVSPQFQVRKQTDQQSIEAVSGVSEISQGRTPDGITAARAVKLVREQAVGRMRLKSRSIEEHSMLRLGKVTANMVAKHYTTRRKLQIYDANNMIKHIEFDPDQLNDFFYSVRVAPGTSAGIDKESMTQLMLQLTQLGVIQPKDFVEGTDLPKKGFILEKMEESDQVQAALQQLQGENEELKAILSELTQGDQFPGIPEGEIPAEEEALAIAGQNRAEQGLI